MPRRPSPLWVERERDVECGREPPAARLVHDVPDVLCVVVLVAGDDVEDASPYLFDDFVEAKPESAHGEESLLVRGALGNVEVVSGDCAQRRVVQLARCSDAVEPLCEEVRSWPLFEELALRHIDTGRLRHLRIGELDAPEPEWVGEFFVSVLGNAVELEQPVFEAGGQVRGLAGSNLAGCLVVCNHGLGAGASRRRANREDLGEVVAVAHAGRELAFGL